MFENNLIVKSEKKFQVLVIETKHAHAHVTIEDCFYIISQYLIKGMYVIIGMA